MEILLIPATLIGCTIGLFIAINLPIWLRKADRFINREEIKRREEEARIEWEKEFDKNWSKPRRRK